MSGEAYASRLVFVKTKYIQTEGRGMRRPKTLYTVKLKTTDYRCTSFKALALSTKHQR